ncbi:hypothetical protein FRC02_006081 [Tulasnella sp. 418]|nr:hypothetical protein FRC02_006081 [Tulasnella sp. 418]
MPSRTSLEYVKKGHKIICVDRPWYFGYSTGKERLTTPPSWDSKRIQPDLADVHVHCARRKGKSDIYQRWVFARIQKGKRGWMDAEQGFQHPKIRHHPTDFSAYRLICETNPQGPKWVKSATIARHERSKRRENLAPRLVESERTRKPAPKSRASSVTDLDDQRSRTSQMMSQARDSWESELEAARSERPSHFTIIADFEIRIHDAWDIKLRVEIPHDNNNKLKVSQTDGLLYELRVCEYQTFPVQL